MSAHRLTTDHRPLTTAFTLVEIMVVIGIVVLLVAISIPAFNLITGSKSIEGATNQLAASLGRARMLAIGLQKPFGVIFLKDQKTQRTVIGIVTTTDAPTTLNFTPPLNNPISDWLELYDADFISLPAGVSLQTMCDCQMTATVRTDDGYLGFNTRCETNMGANTLAPVGYGGVILFDGTGQLVASSYGFKCEAVTNGTQQWTQLGTMLGFNGAVFFDVIPGPPPARVVDPTQPSQIVPLSSQFGFVMFETDLFNAANSTETVAPALDAKLNALPYGSAATAGTEAYEETWIDQNATPFLINRFNGTIVKGQ